jgi:hypothetical protein
MISNCPRCRRPYAAEPGSDHCPMCTSEAHQPERMVHTFLSRQTGGTIDEISARTRASRERVIELMMQGRLLVSRQNTRQAVR